jgi:DNA-binding transcriptional MerR regulator
MKRAEVDEAALSIGDLARLSGISAKTIRFYERKGILPTPQRASNGYRQYRRADANRVRLLSQLRRLGLPLSALRSLIASADAATCDDVRRSAIALADLRIAAIDREIAALQAHRARVAAFRDALGTLCLDTTSEFADCENLACLTEPQRCLSALQSECNDSGDGLASRKGGDAMPILTAQQCPDGCCDGDGDCGCCDCGCCGARSA